MANGFSRSPRLIKGALIELTETAIVPVPNIIPFQYNPETLTREMTPWAASGSAGGADAEQSQATEQPFDPRETFTLQLVFDATDALETPESHPTAVVSGVADRIAALELLLYPTGSSLLAQGIAKVVGKDIVPRGQVPVILFVWGPGRIVPVRIKTFSVEEQAFSPTLYPIRATVSVDLQVLTPESFGTGRQSDSGKPKLTASEELAVKAYQFTRLQKETLARAGQLGAAASALRELPSAVQGQLGP